MIELTMNECNSFCISTIDYEKEEIKIRDKNINILYDLMSIISDDLCSSIMENKSLNFNSIELPYKLTAFYQKYIGKVDQYTKNQTIVSKIRAEYSDLIIKISNFAERWSYEEEFVKNELLNNNDMFLLTFAKDPGKQTFHQHFAAQWLSSLPFVENFIELPASGKDALFISKGCIIKGDLKKSKGNELVPKSIDFSWEYTFHNKTLKFYATHKHTKISGGSQDNQYRDVQDFHTHAKECIDCNCCLLSITDGPYYLLNDTSTAISMSKLDFLNSSVFKGRCNFATTTNLFAFDVIPRIISWLENNFDCQDISEEILKLNTLKLACAFV